MTDEFTCSSQYLRQAVYHSRPLRTVPPSTTRSAKSSTQAGGLLCKLRDTGRALELRAVLPAAKPTTTPICLRTCERRPRESGAR